MWKWSIIVCQYKQLSCMQLLPGVLMSRSYNTLSRSLYHSTKAEEITMLIRQALFCLPRGKLKRFMLSPSLTCMLSTKNPERKDRRHKINLGWWQQKRDPDYRKSPVTSQGLSSSWTMKQTVYYGSILLSELIRQHS